ncbi:MAG: hypothetical protein KDD47_20140, partial [Acidobacteria bacterium]|nr:hypothetical protein [Acidobacteriota bacterium]
VEPGAFLGVDGGAVLKGIEACEGMWEGIQVLGDPSLRQLPMNQGVVRLSEGAMIRDALTGIRTGRTAYNANGHPVPSFQSPGGIVQVFGGRFRNNRKGVEFLPYTDPMTPAFNRSAFINARFEATDVMRDPDFVDARGRRLSVSEHLTLFEVRGVRVFGTDFVHSAGLDEDLRGTGIGAFDATFTVGSRCLDTVFDPVPGCQNQDRSRFEDLAQGIVTEATLSTRRMSVRDSDFVDVQRGITTTAQSFDRIEDNNFQISPGFSGATYGVAIDGGEGFVVAGNHFTSDLSANNAAVQVRDSGLLPNQLAENEVETVVAGFRLFGDNPELDVFCNRFTANPEAALVVGGLLKAQGSCQPGEFAADNTFATSAATHILSGLGPGFTYHHSLAPLAQPVTVGPVTLVGCPGQVPTCPRPDPCQNPADCPIEPQLLVRLAQEGRYPRLAAVLEEAALQEAARDGANLWLARYFAEEREFLRAEAALSRISGLLKGHAVSRTLRNLR